MPFVTVPCFLLIYTRSYWPLLAILMASRYVRILCAFVPCACPSIRFFQERSPNLDAALFGAFQLLHPVRPPFTIRIPSPVLEHLAKTFYLVFLSGKRLG